MPKHLEPLTKLTKQQWKAIIRREMDKTGRLTDSLVNKIMKTEPPAEAAMGRLERAVPTGEVGQQIFPGRFLGETKPFFENLPIEEARAKYFASPESYRAPSMFGAPSAKVLEQFKPGPESGAFARDIAYTRQKFEPIIPSGTRNAASVLRGEAEEEAASASLRRFGLTEDDIRPEMPVKQFLRSKGVSLKEETPVIAEVLQTAMLADLMWKEGEKGAKLLWEQMGGGPNIKSAQSKIWDAYRASSNLNAKFSSGRDYFISSFSRWRQDSGQFTKKYPREAKLLKKLWDAFQEGLPEGE
jgi:hypothetical protein